MDYLVQNRDFWNKRVGYHMRSAFYDMPSFLNGNTSLKEIELDLLGNVMGKKILHLQCHFGQDTISLGRMGASVTGVDLSDEAIAEAEKLSGITGINAKFIRSDIYDLPSVLDETFDIVFTTYGTIGWLPDLDKWADVVSRYLKPGGMFVFVEFHPVIWMFDNHFTKIEYSYFKDKEIIEEMSGTYADRDAPLVAASVSWNHSLSEVYNSLQRNGLRVTTFNEYDHSPYNCLEGMVEVSQGKFEIGSMSNKLPLVYSLTAIKQ